jgi:hypothetical protein
MAVVRVKLIGSGTAKDPFRAPLPFYNELLTNYSEGWVLAQVPDSEFPDEPHKIDPSGPETSYGRHIRTLDDAGHKKWHAHLDGRYRERKGEFRPEIV